MHVVGRRNRIKFESISRRGVLKRASLGIAKTKVADEIQAPAEKRKTISTTRLANLCQQIGDWASDLPDLPDLMDKGTFTAGQNRLYYPELLSDAHSHPVRLSRWIDEKRYIDVSSGSPIPTITLNLMQIKAARLLCEAVLRFTPGSARRPHSAVISCRLWTAQHAAFWSHTSVCGWTGGPS